MARKNWGLHSRERPHTYCLVIALMGCCLFSRSADLAHAGLFDLLGNTKNSERDQLNEQRQELERLQRATPTLGNTAGKKLECPSRDRQYCRDQLIAAAFQGDTARVKSLLAAGADVNTRDSRGWTALMEAISATMMRDNLSVVQLLLTAGADVNVTTEDGSSALSVALVFSHHHQPDIVKALCTAGADPNATTKAANNMSVLALAASRGSEAAVEALLDAGANVNLKTPDDEFQGLQALRAAIPGGHIQVVKLLLAAGAADQATSQQRASLVRDAEEAGQTAVAQLFKETPGFSVAAATAGETYTLTVHASPDDSLITLLNSRVEYAPGMRLRPGSYQLQVEKNGYETRQQWLTVADANLVVEVTLQPRSAGAKPVGVLATAARRLALVIGNAAYEIGALHTPVNDATDMASTLERLGFRVTLLHDVPRQKMEEAVDTFSRQLRTGGVGLFYFAGHGVQIEGQNYLIPIGTHLEAATDVKYQTVNAGWVLERMEGAGNDANIVILDACRDIPFKRQWRSNQGGLAVMEGVRGALIAYATAPGRVVSEESGRNGLYTQQLLRYLAEPGLNIEEMFKQVRIAVAQATQNKQIPWESSSLIGELYFAGASPSQ